MTENEKQTVKDAWKIMFREAWFLIQIPYVIAVCIFCIIYEKLIGFDDFDIGTKGSNNHV